MSHTDPPGPCVRPTPQGPGLTDEDAVVITESELTSELLSAKAQTLRDLVTLVEALPQDISVPQLLAVCREAAAQLEAKAEAPTP